MEKQVYNVKTINFEGPFGVLLNLIEERKLFINEISLAQVTEDYLKYLNSLMQQSTNSDKLKMLGGFAGRSSK